MGRGRGNLRGKSKKSLSFVPAAARRRKRASCGSRGPYRVEIGRFPQEESRKKQKKESWMIREKKKQMAWLSVGTRGAGRATWESNRRGRGLLSVCRSQDPTTRKEDG